jgi:sulfiredoxin
VHYGFNGCHRFQAHAEAGAATILCRVRRANRATLRAHVM